MHTACIHVHYIGENLENGPFGARKSGRAPRAKAAKILNSLYLYAEVPIFFFVAIYQYRVTAVTRLAMNTA